MTAHIRGLAGDVTEDDRLVLVEASQRSLQPDGHPIRTQVCAELTRHPNLVIAPSFHRGRFGGGFMLLHVPSGRAVRNGYDVDDLRLLALSVDHLDWAAANPDTGDLPTALREAAAELIRTWQDRIEEGYGDV